MTRDEIMQRIEQLRQQALRVRGLGASASMYRIRGAIAELERQLENA